MRPPRPPDFGGAGETGGVVSGLGRGVPGLSTGALEIVPSPVGLVARSKEPFDMPGAVNLLLRSVGWPPGAAAPAPGAIGAAPGWAPGCALGWGAVLGAAEPGVVTSGRGPAAGGAAGACGPAGVGCGLDGVPADCEPDSGEPADCEPDSGEPVGCGPNDGVPVGFGVSMPLVPEDTGGVKVPEVTGGVRAGLAPGVPTGALEIVPSPTGLLGRSNAPFAAPGAVNLLLRSVD
ncbi:hypothetical protein [Umezawaea sp.]|uniref:hypothetical protein n=1 Tax=Umezawaea sp. TaxID=1955258 RepID=UPI002ED5BA42